MLAIITAFNGTSTSQLSSAVDAYSSIYESGCTAFTWYLQASSLTEDQSMLLQSLPFLSLCVSTDNSIYSAWNSVLDRLASEDKVIFAGVDDILTAEVVRFSSLFFLREFDVLSFAVQMISTSGLVLGLRLNPPLGQVSLASFPYCHPGLVFSSKLFSARRFNDNYRIVSDGLFYAQHQYFNVVYSTNEPLVLMSVGGISNSRRGARLRAMELSHAFFHGRIPLTLPSLFRMFASLPSFLLSFLPASLYHCIQRFRWSCIPF
jgi:hypothetical protein